MHYAGKLTKENNVVGMVVSLKTSLMFLECQTKSIDSLHQESMLVCHNSDHLSQESLVSYNAPSNIFARVLLA